MPMRLFIAVNFNHEITAKLENIIQKLKSQAVQGNFTRRENLHITLAFLGETTKVSEIKKVMDNVKIGAFQLTIEGFGKFPRSGGDIYWLGVEKNHQLEAIHDQLTAMLLESGFELDKKPFKPHLTLGREIILKENFEQEVFAKNIAPMRMKVEKISLMKSERINGKLVYTEIYAKYL